MKIQSYFTLLVLLLLSGCATYEIERGASTSIKGISGVPKGEAGKTTVEIKAYSPINLDEFFIGSSGIVFLQKNFVGVNAENITIFNITGVEDREICYVGGNYGASSLSACRDNFINTRGLIKATRIGSNLYLGVNENKYVIFNKNFDGSSKYLTVEYIDYSERMLAWKDRYKDVQKGGIDGYFDYANEYPGAVQVKPIMSDMFNKFFSVKIIGKEESEQRSTRERGIVTSAAGSCKDITRTIEIKPKNQLPPRDISIDVKYILRRTYSPYILNEKDDPLYLNKSYVLGKNNAFSITDDIAFNCVPTAVRVHSAVLTFVGKVFGAGEKDTGINTELTNIGFDIDFVKIE